MYFPFLLFSLFPSLFSFFLFYALLSPLPLFLLSLWGYGMRAQECSRRRVYNVAKQDRWPFTRELGSWHTFGSRVSVFFIDHKIWGRCIRTVETHYGSIKESPPFLRSVGQQYFPLPHLHPNIPPPLASSTSHLYPSPVSGTGAPTRPSIEPVRVREFVQGAADVSQGRVAHEYNLLFRRQNEVFLGYKCYRPWLTLNIWTGNPPFGALVSGWNLTATEKCGIVEK